MQVLQRLSKLVFLPVLLGGCATLGPASVEHTRGDYNQVIQRTNDQELLLNLVRLHYRDSLYFLNVERVASAMEFNRSLGVSGSFPEAARRTLGITSGVAFNERPTIFYAPLEGERFVRQMMSPFDLRLMVLLINSGWSVERVFMVMLREMNGLKNAPTASGPTPALAPAARDYRDFRQAVQLLRALQLEGGISIGHMPQPEDGLELRFSPEAGQSDDAKRFRTLLKLAPGRDRYSIRTGLGQADDTTIAVTPRSLVATMSSLSQSIVPPERHLAQGLVTETRTPAGQAFNWQTVFGNVMQVHASEAEPDTPLRVKYRGHWFYVRDNDLDSKSTFSLLSQLFALQAGIGTTSSLNLSFPVGR